MVTALRDGLGRLDPPLRRFWWMNVAALGVAILGLGLAYVLGFRHDDVLVDLAVMVTSFAILTLSALGVRRHGDAAAVLGLVGATTLFALVGTWVTPYLAPATLLLLLVPALVAVPYLGARVIHVIVAWVLVGSALLGVVSELRRPLKDPPTPWVGMVVLGLTLPLAVAVVAFWVLESYRRLEAQAWELRVSRGRLVTVADAARQRLERDLHDGAQQRLVAMSVRIARARGALRDGRLMDAEATLEALAEDNRLALTELRELAHGIYPSLLAERGLVAALRSAVRRVPLPVSLRADEVRRRPADVESAAYFCILEALQNVSKYSGAATAVVTVADRRDGDGLEFSVEDDGVGFDVADVRARGGLAAMEARLGVAGGRLEVTSDAGRGTVVRGSLP